jgi:uncharacterized oxidoreductase
MKMSGNTVFITGGGTGIGRGLAEAFHRRGNHVIIAGRRKTVLEEVTQANPGMEAIELDITDTARLAHVAKTIIAERPEVNLLINNSGMMKMDDVSGVLDDDVLTSTIETNLYGPMRMTSAFVEHLKSKAEAAVINVTSGLAFTPLAMTATYSATKAAIHSYTLSLRFKLRNTSVKVLELAPPYVQTELMGEHQKSDPRAMPLDAFIAETMELLATDAEEILVERVKMLRNNVGPNEGEFVTRFNAMMAEGQ